LRRVYLLEIDKIDFAFLDEELAKIEFTLFENPPIVKGTVIMDISTILKFKECIDDMIELKNKKEKLRNARSKK